MTNEQDVSAFLEADHVAVDRLFSEYRSLAGSRTSSAIKRRLELAQNVCLILTVHARLEREVFYPALQAAASVAEIVAEAQVEHECTHYLITRIEQTVTVDTAFDALVKTLSFYVGHFMQKERTWIFPMLRNSRRLDLPLLRQTLEVRRQVILAEESNRVAARLQCLADEKALRRECVEQKDREGAKARKLRREAVTLHTLALRAAR